MRLRASLVGGILLVIGLLVFPAAARACSWRPAKYRVEAVVAAPPPLPEGVSIEAAPDGGLVINNSSATPLYVIGAIGKSLNERSAAPFYASGPARSQAVVFEPLAQTFADGSGPTHKLLGGRAWEWRPLLRDGEPTDEWQWQDPLRAEDGVTIDVYREAFSAVAQNPLTRDLAEHAIPAPQLAELTLVYGDQLLRFPFEIRYALNTETVSSESNPCASIQSDAIDFKDGRIIIRTADGRTLVHTTYSVVTIVPTAESPQPDRVASNRILRIGLGVAESLLRAGGLA